MLSAKKPKKKTNFKVEIIKILHYLQFLLTNTNILDLSFLAFNIFNLLHQIFTGFIFFYNLANFRIIYK